MIALAKVGFQPLSLEQAFNMQYRLVDIVRQHLDGYAQLQAGDYGVHPDGNRPQRTVEVEAILADFFDAEAAVFVRGAGTGAIRFGLTSVTSPGSGILVHTPPTYPSTLQSFLGMGLRIERVDMNDLDQVAQAVQQHDLSAVLIQHTYQTDEDTYIMQDVIATIRQHKPDLPIISDDNYAVMKVPRIGVQQGTDVSAFSLFKLLGSEGVGLVVGRQDVIDRIHSMNYSGGSQVQGPEAMEALRSLIYAPVVHAGTANTIQTVLERAQDYVPDFKLRVSWIQGIHLVVEFSEPIADLVREAAVQLGALPYPVGAESRYEVSPLFYRMSGTFRKREPELARYMMRILPMRAGADTVLSILRDAIDIVQTNGRTE